MGETRQERVLRARRLIEAMAAMGREQREKQRALEESRAEECSAMYRSLRSEWMPAQQAWRLTIQTVIYGPIAREWIAAFNN